MEKENQIAFNAKDLEISMLKKDVEIMKLGKDLQLARFNNSGGGESSTKVKQEKVRVSEQVTSPLKNVNGEYN